MREIDGMWLLLVGYLLWICILQALPVDGLVGLSLEGLCLDRTIPWAALGARRRQVDPSPVI